MIDVRYSVYSAKDDLPLIIGGTIPQCAKALGITYTAFGEREVKAVWADFKSSGCGYYKSINPILCVYADGSKERYEAHPF